MTEVVVTSLRLGGTRRSVPTRKADYVRLIFLSCAGGSGRLVLTISLCLMRRSIKRVSTSTTCYAAFETLVCIVLV